MIVLMGFLMIRHYEKDCLEISHSCDQLNAFQLYSWKSFCVLGVEIAATMRLAQNLEPIRPNMVYARHFVVVHLGDSACFIVRHKFTLLPFRVATMGLGSGYRRFSWQRNWSVLSEIACLYTVALFVAKWKNDHESQQIVSRGSDFVYFCDSAAIADAVAIYAPCNRQPQLQFQPGTQAFNPSVQPGFLWTMRWNTGRNFSCLSLLVSPAHLVASSLPGNNNSRPWHRIFIWLLSGYVFSYAGRQWNLKQFIAADPVAGHHNQPHSLVFRERFSCSGGLPLCA